MGRRNRARRTCISKAHGVLRSYKRNLIEYPRTAMQDEVTILALVVCDCGDPGIVDGRVRLPLGEHHNVSRMDSTLIQTKYSHLRPHGQRYAMFPQRFRNLAPQPTRSTALF